MEPRATAGKTTEVRGWIWITAFLAVGIFNIADWLYGGLLETHRLLSGAGFLLMSPHLFLSPPSFTKPGSAEVMRKLPERPVVQWLAVIGFLFLISGAIAQWL